jgi:hypothetical protein
MSFSHETALYLVQKARAHQLLFVNVSPLHDPPALLSALTQLLENERTRPLIVDIREAVAQLKELPFGDEAGRTTVITGLESMAGMDDKEVHRLLAPLRPVANELVQADGRVIVFSRVPRVRVSSALGSMLLLDCFECVLPPLSHEAAYNECVALGVEEHADDIIAHSGGFAAILQVSVEETLGSKSNNARRAAARDGFLRIMAEALECLGPELCGWLERFVFDLATVNLDPAEAMDVTGDLISSSLAMETAGRVLLLPQPLTSLWRQALRSYVDTSTDHGSEWIRTGSALYEMERHLRNAVRTKLQQDHGENWPTSGLGDLALSSVGLATSEVGREVEVDEIDPLAWITFDKLLDLANATYAGPGWARVIDDLRRDVLPIRNRFAHMRIVRLGDARTVLRVKRQLDQQISSEWRRQA